ncbi:cellulase family glycosylhydrolase [Microbacterium sp. PMB16]|uniref:cellulase family glycosylhydrolase n=1 Tax=Microbacterium sp. PMB16 TaxID=3120157 RepID=UPI003F4B26B6
MKKTMLKSTLAGLAALLAAAALILPAAASAQTVGAVTTQADTLISQGRPATASTTEGSAYAAAKAVDGSTTTRWASAEGNAAQWITVDLGAGATVSKVVLQWEAAYAKGYKVQISADGSSWTTLATETVGNGGSDTWNVSGTGRYLRINATVRGTAWGYSLWELKAYGTLGDPGGPSTGTPVEKAGTLKVCGLKLCNEDGVPVQLRGMSTHGLQWHRDCMTDSAFDALADDWSADVVRLSTYVEDEGYVSNPTFFTNLAGDLIQKTHDRGMYSIADWHILEKGDPNVNLENAKKFFKAIATRHGSKGTVLYEIANEPSGVAWSTIKTYAEKIIPVIRAIDPDAVILVGTPDWSSFGVSGDNGPAPIIANPVNATNIMYVFHFYATSHRDEYLTALDETSDVLPTFVTEWGAEEYTGGGALDLVMAKRYLDLMEEKDISWVKWNFSDDPLSGAAFKVGTCDTNGPWTGSTLKPVGTWVINHVRAGEL